MSGYTRQTERHDRRMEVSFSYDGKEYTSHTRNISLGGMFIDLDEVIPYGAKLRVKIRLPSQAEPIDIGGEVRWCEPASATQQGGIGVRFEGLRARDVWAINKFLEQQPGSRD